jgi:hypothetical protein
MVGATSRDRASVAHVAIMFNPDTAPFLDTTLPPHASCRRELRYAGQSCSGSRPSRHRSCRCVVNLKTAKALGLTIPPTLLARGDRIRILCAAMRESAHDPCRFRATFAMASHRPSGIQRTKLAGEFIVFGVVSTLKADANGGLNTFLSHPEPARSSSTCMRN